MMSFIQSSEHLKTVRSQEVAGYSHASKHGLLAWGEMQIIVKMLTGKRITFGVENQQRHRQCERQGRHSSRSAGRQLEDGKTLSDCNIQKEKFCVARQTRNGVERYLDERRSLRIRLVRLRSAWTDAGTSETCSSVFRQVGNEVQRVGSMRNSSSSRTMWMSRQ